MKKLLAPLVLVLCAFTTIAEEWTTITLMEKVTVSLPGKPKEDNSKGVPVQMVLLEDSTQVIAGAVDYSIFGMDAEMMGKLAGTEEFKQQMEAGVSAQPGVKLLKNEAGKFNDKYFSYDMTLELDKAGKKSLVSIRTVIYKQYGLTLTYIPGKRGENAELRDKAFNSLKIAD